MPYHVHYSPVLGGQLLSSRISQPEVTCQLLIDSYPKKKVELCQCRRIFASWNNFISRVVLDMNGFHRLVSVAWTRFSFLFWKFLFLLFQIIVCEPKHAGFGLMWPPNRFHLLIICSDPTRQRECSIYQADIFHVSVWKTVYRLRRRPLRKVCSFIPSCWSLLHNEAPPLLRSYSDRLRWEVLKMDLGDLWPEMSAIQLTSEVKFAH